MRLTSDLAWHPELSDPIGDRNVKPRTTGLTMVIDSGLGSHAFEDMLSTGGNYIDIVKIGFGTPALYSQSMLQQKIEKARAQNITIMPGGTFLEIAVHKNKIDSWFEAIAQLGFNGIEVSDGTIELDRKLRNTLIQKGRDYRFEVFTEYGKKQTGTIEQIDSLIETVNEDLAQGAKLVAIEGRESGKNAGLFDQTGSVQIEEIEKIMDRVSSAAQLIWETPLKSQQIQFLQQFGANINLGNIASTDVIALEALRRGLRSDTFPI